MPPLESGLTAETPNAPAAEPVQLIRYDGAGNLIPPPITAIQSQDDLDALLRAQAEVSQRTARPATPSAPAPAAVVPPSNAAEEALRALTGKLDGVIERLNSAAQAAPQPQTPPAAPQAAPAASEPPAQPSNENTNNGGTSLVPTNPEHNVLVQGIAQLANLMGSLTTEVKGLQQRNYESDLARIREGIVAREQKLAQDEGEDLIPDLVQGATEAELLASVPRARESWRRNVKPVLDQIRRALPESVRNFLPENGVVPSAATTPAGRSPQLKKYLGEHEGPITPRMIDDRIPDEALPAVYEDLKREAYAQIGLKPDQRISSVYGEDEGPRRRVIKPPTVNTQRDDGRYDGNIHDLAG